MQWPLLAGVPEEEVRQLMAVARRRRFARDEVVFHRGDPADTLHLIAKGRFAVRVTTPLGDTANVAILGPGQAFGELALVGGEPVRTATVAALEPSETRSVHQVDFAALRERHPQTADVIIAVLAAQVKRLTEHLVEALYVPADRRVLKRLAELAGVYGDGEDGPIEIPLRQEEIAALAGASRATTNRVLREAQAKGTIELSRGRTTVLDPDALSR